MSIEWEDNEGMDKWMEDRQSLLNKEVTPRAARNKRKVTMTLSKLNRVLHIKRVSQFSRSINDKDDNEATHGDLPGGGDL